MKYVLLLFLLFPAYLKPSNMDLQQDPIVTQHFNKDEVKQLEQILTFFDNEVRIISNTNGPLENSYHVFFKMVKDSAWAGNPYSPILRIPSEKVHNLFSSLSDTLKDELWVISRYVTPSNGDSVADLDIRSGGKYEAFLKSSSTENQTLDKYYKTFEYGHGMTPSLIANMILFSDRLNLKRESQRLIVAVHYLAIRETGELRRQLNKSHHKQIHPRKD